MTNTVESTNPGIPAVNFHLWQPCNMACTYCFAHFDESRPYLRQEKAELPGRALKVVEEAAAANIRKITFVGGEPLLCPWLGNLLRRSKELNMTTMVVTNGSRLTERWMERHSPWVDWVALSIDSLVPATNARIGRMAAGKPLGEHEYQTLVDRVHAYGIRLKINTVVSSYNWEENLAPFIEQAGPERWKLFQVLKIRGQNDAGFPDSEISNDQFAQFVARHVRAQGSTRLIAESNDAMTGS